MGHEQGHEAEELQWEEYKLEAANVLAVLIAAPMYAAGMKFWYFDNEHKDMGDVRDQTQKESVPANNNRMMDVSDVLFHDLF
jgi:hypothetical protein